MLIDGVPVHGTELLQCKPTSANTSLKLQFVVELSWVRLYCIYCIVRDMCTECYKNLNYKICKIFGLYNYMYQGRLKTLLKYDKCNRDVIKYKHKCYHTQKDNCATYQ